MRKLIIFILPIILLSSCVTQRACERRFPPSEKTIVEIHDTTIVTDTVFRIEQRTIEVHDTVPCGDFEASKDSGGVKIIIKVKDRYLTAKCECEALEIKARIYSKVRKISKTTELVRTVHERAKVNWWMWLLIGIAIGFVVPKLVMVYLKTLRPV